MNWRQYALGIENGYYALEILFDHDPRLHFQPGMPIHEVLVFDTGYRVRAIQTKKVDLLLDRIAVDVEGSPLGTRRLLMRDIQCSAFWAVPLVLDGRFLTIDAVHDLMIEKAKSHEPAEDPD